MDSARPVSKSSNDIQIYVGIAEQVESRPVSGNVVVNGTHAEVRFEPHVWIVDKQGERLHFWGDQFANVLGGDDGHQLIVVKKRSNGSIMRVCNQSMGTTVDANDMIPLKVGPGNFIVATGFMAVVGIFPAMIAYISLVTSISDTLNGAATYELDLGWHFPIILVAVLALCAWLMTKWVSGSHAKVEALSGQIDEAFAENSLKHYADPQPAVETFMTRTKRWMTRVDSYAHHGSTSYGEITPERFAEVVKGATPTTGEKVRVCQGLTESPARPLNRDNANELADELGITREELEARCQELCGCAMGAHAFPEELPLPPRLQGKN